MEKFYRFVKRLAGAFDQSGLDYAFTGALAVSLYGSPRTTSDVDVMIAVSGKTNVKAKVAKALQEAGLEVEERKIYEAISSGFNIATFKDKASAYTVDIIFSNEKLGKQAGTVAGLKTFFQTPEDLISAKLRMIKVTVPRERALKDEEDVRAILAFTKVNLAVVELMAKKEGTLEILQALTESK
jgi:hypothetical protein